MDVDVEDPPQPSRPPHSTTPAGLELRLKLLSLFCKSAVAANSFPQTLEVTPQPLPCSVVLCAKLAPKGAEGAHSWLLGPCL